MNRKVVCKFGGTSLADAQAIRQVASVVEADADRRFVVVSAPGKRNKSDAKVTDLLYLLYETAHAGIDASATLEAIWHRYHDITSDLGIDLQLEREFEDIALMVAHESRDYAGSRGEYLNGLIMAKVLGATFIDPAQMIFFTKDGKLDEGKTYETLAKALAGDGRYVIPGFYGVGANGGIKTFSRGGSDVTGSIVARAIQADVYENWTDVSGLLMADPRCVDNPKPMAEVTYLELRELSYMGAQVLHDEAIFPVCGCNIPINIRNTWEPEHPGTLIVTERNAKGMPVVGVAGKQGFSAIHMNKALMNRENGFGRKLLAIIDSHDLSFEHMPSGIDNLSVIIHGDTLKPKLDQVLQDIQSILKVDSVKVYHNLSLLAVVGTGMAFHCGIAAKVFSALAGAGINIRMIDQGASELTIILSVEDKDYQNAIQAIYNALVQI